MAQPCLWCRRNTMLNIAKPVTLCVCGERVVQLTASNSCPLPCLWQGSYSWLCRVAPVSVRDPRMQQLPRVVSRSLSHVRARTGRQLGPKVDGALAGGQVLRPQPR